MPKPKPPRISKEQLWQSAVSLLLQDQHPHGIWFNPTVELDPSQIIDTRRETARRALARRTALMHPPSPLDVSGAAYDRPEYPLEWGAPPHPANWRHGAMWPAPGQWPPRRP